MADEGTEIHVGDLEREGAPFQFGDRDDLVDDLHQAVQRRLQLLDELLPLHRRDVRVPQDVGDPLRNRHRGPQLVGDVRQEVGLRRRALGHVRPQLVELRLELHRANDGASDLGPERRCDHRGEDDTASERGTDRAEHDLGTLLAQDVPGGAGGEGLGDTVRVACRRASDDARGGRGGAQAPHQLRAGGTFEAQVDHDHVRTRASGRLDRAERVGRDLDLEIGRRVEQVVLQARDLVRRVEEQHGRHLLGISADPLGG